MLRSTMAWAGCLEPEIMAHNLNLLIEMWQL